MPDGWTRSEMESLADPRSYMRGVAYQRDGRVEIKQHDSDRVTAIVRGSMPYDVELRRTPRPSWSCNCPVGEDGGFCKHCVAVALEVAQPDRAADRRPTRNSGDGQPDLRHYLADSTPTSWSTCSSSRSGTTGGCGSASRHGRSQREAARWT